MSNEEKGSHMADAYRFQGTEQASLTAWVVFGAACSSMEVTRAECADEDYDAYIVQFYGLAEAMEWQRQEKLPFRPLFAIHDDSSIAFTVYYGRLDGTNVQFMEDELMEIPTTIQISKNK